MAGGNGNFDPKNFPTDGGESFLADWFGDQAGATSPVSAEDVQQQQQQQQQPAQQVEGKAKQQVGDDGWNWNSGARIPDLS